MSSLLPVTHFSFVNSALSTRFCETLPGRVNSEPLIEEKRHTLEPFSCMKNPKEEGRNRGVSLKKDIEAGPDICGKLQFKAAKGINRLQFLLLEYRLFRDSDEGSALPLTLPWPLSPLSLALHVVKTRALSLLKLPCYFVKLETKTVGLWAIQEDQERLLVASLGVSRKFRRLGIGTCILDCVEAIAKRMGKRWLEVDVLRKNVPAQQFYTKYGFTFVQGKKMRYVMRGRKPLRVTQKCY